MRHLLSIIQNNIQVTFWNIYLRESLAATTNMKSKPLSCIPKVKPYGAPTVAQALNKPYVFPKVTYSEVFDYGQEISN